MKVAIAHQIQITSCFFEVSTDYLLGRTDTPASTPQEQNEQEFQAFINDPELGVWYKELPRSDEEELRKLRTIWEMIKAEKIGIPVSWLPICCNLSQNFFVNLIVILTYVNLTKKIL